MSTFTSWAGDLQVAVHVEQAGHFLHAFFEDARGAIQLIQILRLQRVLIHGARLLSAHADQRRILR
jgi:hypothetical protein